MKLAKSLLLGSATAFVAVAGANAADLPSKKAAPVSYVKVCDAYGAGFYTIPGTDTCIKVGGRVRADYGYVPQQKIYDQAKALPFVYGDPATATIITGSSTGALGTYSAVVVPNTTIFKPSSSAGKLSGAQNAMGWETRGRIDVDARTATAYGAVQTVISMRMSRTTGVYNVANGADSSSASPTLEAAYTRFAGFTFGAAKDNFAFMPSRFYGAGHWASFANGAKQLAYTASLGGGLSVTAAIQDYTDTTVGGFDYTAVQGSTGGVNELKSRGPADVNRIPQLNGRIDFDQSWGSLSATGAYRRIEASGTSAELGPVARYEGKANAYALGLGAKFNLPTLAAGDALWIAGAVADGMTEYTTNWSSFKSSDVKRMTGGDIINHPSYLYTSGDTAKSNGLNNLQTVKSWNVAAILDHYWTPTVRTSVMGSYGKISGNDASRNCTAIANSIAASSTAANGCFDDANVWNTGIQTAWYPTKDFEIGAELLYARASYKMPTAGSGIAANDKIFGNDCLGGAAGGATCSVKNWQSRLRVERTF